jgi:flagellar biogenesis protein FliO
VGRSPAKRQSPKLALPPMESFTTAGAGLAIVVGLFLVCAWMMRRAGPKPTTPLPSEAVAVLGRVPLAARNFAHLLQVGNKLVLVAITPDGVAPITEITDPIEVQRMLGLCVGNRKQSTSAEFHDVLEQLAKEPASGFLGSEVLGNQAAASYASKRR